MSNKFAKFLDEPIVKQPMKRERTEKIVVHSQTDKAQPVLSAKLFKTTIAKVNLLKVLQHEKSLAAVIDKALAVYIEQLPLEIQEQLK